MAKGLIVATNFKPRKGGVAEHIHQTARHLRQIGETIVVLAPSMNEDSAFDNSCGYPVIRVAVRQRPRTKFRAPPGLSRDTLLRTIYRKARKIDAEYLMCNRWEFSLGTAVLLASRLLRIPFFIFAHGSEITRSTNSVLKNLSRTLVFRQAERIYCVSRYTEERVKLLGLKENKTEVVLNGYDVGLSDRWAGCQRGLPGLHLKGTVSPESKIVLTVGRLEERKGIDKVIEAMPIVKKAVPNATYLIVGDGEDRPRLEEMVRKLNVDGYVHFLGALEDDEKYECYQQCNLFVMPNRTLPDGDAEGFGIVFLEANAFCKPVIGGRSGGAGDAIVDGVTGLLVDPEDVQQLAERIIALLLDTEYAHRLGRNGREHVERVLNWKTSAEKLRASIHRSLSGT